MIAFMAGLVFGAFLMAMHLQGKTPKLPRVGGGGKSDKELN